MKLFTFSPGWGWYAVKENIADKRCTKAERWWWDKEVWWEITSIYQYRPITRISFSTLVKRPPVMKHPLATCCIPIWLMPWRGVLQSISVVDYSYLRTGSRQGCSESRAARKFIRWEMKWGEKRLIITLFFSRSLVKSSVCIPQHWRWYIHGYTCRWCRMTLHISTQGCGEICILVSLQGEILIKKSTYFQYLLYRLYIQTYT